MEAGIRTAEHKACNSFETFRSGWNWITNVGLQYKRTPIGSLLFTIETFYYSRKAANMKLKVASENQAIYLTHVFLIFHDGI